MCCSGRGIRRRPPRSALRLRRERAQAARLDVGFELVAELGDHRADRHRHRVAEHAQAMADDVVLDGGHDLQVHRGRLAAVDPLEHVHRPVRALAAGGALAAGLVAVELRDLQRDVEDRRRVVDDDDRARAEHRAGFGHGVEVVGDVQVVAGQHGAEEPPGNQHLTVRPSGRAAGQAVDDLARGDAQLDLVVAGALDVAGDRHELGAGRGLGAELGVLGAAHTNDRGDRRRASRRC